MGADRSKKRDPEKGPQITHSCRLLVYLRSRRRTQTNPGTPCTCLRSRRETRRNDLSAARCRECTRSHRHRRTQSDRRPKARRGQLQWPCKTPQRGCRLRCKRCPPRHTCSRRRLRRCSVSQAMSPPRRPTLTPRRSSGCRSAGSRTLQRHPTTRTRCSLGSPCSSRRTPSAPAHSGPPASTGRTRSSSPPSHSHTWTEPR